ncbi:MAG: DUF2804 domain-containing protein, partial [Spirochaetota bacterium]
RIKEWDYYSVISQDKKFGIALTMSDLGYAGMFAICFLDFENGISRQIDTMSVMPRGRTGFSPDSDTGTVSFSDTKLSITFHYESGKRVLTFEAPELENSEGDKGLKGSITLKQPKKLESINIATSWKEKRTAFYYNRKINCMPASGGFSIGKKKYTFTPSEDFGALDWGRGNWTYKNRWYWGSASGYAGGHSFGWNIGYGFSDRSPASENVIFYDGKDHKIDDVHFIIDESDYTKPWKFTSSDKRFEMTFTPVLDRYSKADLKIIRSVQHQVFGYFNGTLILDNGKTVKIKNFLAFAEDVLNWW